MANYTVIKKTDIANGPGVRVSIFFSGCTRKCLGCFNQELWDFNHGKKFTDDTIQYIVDALQPSYITGLSILGGDPLDGIDNRIATEQLLKVVKKILPHKTVWLYTGDIYENVKDLPLLQYVDVLVDGPFILAQKNIMLKFKGSENQRIIDLNKTRKTGKITLLDI